MIGWEHQKEVRQPTETSFAAAAGWEARDSGGGGVACVVVTVIAVSVLCGRFIFSVRWRSSWFVVVFSTAFVPVGFLV